MADPPYRTPAAVWAVAGFQALPSCAWPWVVSSWQQVPTGTLIVFNGIDEKGTKFVFKKRNHGLSFNQKKTKKILQIECKCSHDPLLGDLKPFNFGGR